MAPEPAFRRETGWRHLVAAAGYSWGGLKRLCAETAFRHECAAFAAILVVFALAGASASDYLGAALLFLALVSVEALNTAIEIVMDRVSPEFSEPARTAKDLGSFAVMCLLIANGLYAAWVVLPRLF
ncbi:MAG: diacylglycerol kinase [Flavobacteriaceae bacterium]